MLGTRDSGPCTTRWRDTRTPGRPRPSACRTRRATRWSGSRTCVSPEARITYGCTGMYADAHVAAWRRVVDFVHAWTPAKVCLQLGHSGRKGSTRLMWEGMDEPLDDGNWEVIGPSPIAYGPQNQ